jgi:hypothetical protein
LRHTLIKTKLGSLFTPRLQNMGLGPTGFLCGLEEPEWSHTCGHNPNRGALKTMGATFLHGIQYSGHNFVIVLRRLQEYEQQEMC